MPKVLRDRTESIVWWARHPQLYREAFRIARRKLFPRENDVASSEEMRETAEWCRENTVDTAEALRLITGTAWSEQDFQQQFADELAEATRRQDECPVSMGGGGNIHLLYYIAEYLGATRVVETGVAYGWSSLALLLSLSKRNDSLLISTDRPYPRTSSDRWAGCVVPDRLRPDWQLIQNADREALPKALARLPELDLCHYDSDKSRAGRQWAYSQLWKALRPDGIFLSDDVGNDEEFRRFCESVSVEPIVVRTSQDEGDKDEKFVGVATKPAQA